MTTDRKWLHAMRLRGIDPFTSEKVTRKARGIIIDHVIERVLDYREASLRLFNEGNAEASYWAARAMEDRAIELDCAIAEAKETIAGRKQVSKAKQAAADKSKAAKAKHVDWQIAANRIWSNPQHTNKSAVAVAMMIDKKQADTIRRHIKRPAK